MIVVPVLQRIFQVVGVHSHRSLRELSDVGQGYPPLHGNSLHEGFELRPSRLELGVRLDLLLLVCECLVGRAIPEFRRLQRWEVRIVRLRPDGLLKVRDYLQAVSMPQLALGVLTLEPRRLRMPDPSHGPMPFGGSGVATQDSLCHIGCEVGLGIPTLRPLCRGVVALLLGPSEPTMHSLGLSMPRPVEHGGLLVLPRSLEPPDELGVVQKVPPRR